MSIVRFSALIFLAVNAASGAGAVKSFVKARLAWPLAEVKIHATARTNAPKAVAPGRGLSDALHSRAVVFALVLNLHILTSLGARCRNGNTDDT